MKAFARVDGLWLALLWLASFACYVLGLSSPGYGLVALILVVVTPFMVAKQLKRFRDDCLEGVISFMRGWAYVMFLFLYGGLLFAIAQFLYFTYVDKGYFASALTQMMSAPEMAQSIRQMGLSDMLNETLHQLTTMRPIDLVLNILTTNLLIGMVTGVPIAALMKRGRIEQAK